ncbi:MAG: ion transporter [Leptolyngbyaceae cyanobacterium]
MCSLVSEHRYEATILVALHLAPTALLPSAIVDEITANSSLDFVTDGVRLAAVTAYNQARNDTEPMTLKATIAAYLDDTDQETGGWVTGALATLIVMSAVIFVVETYDISASWRTALTWVDWGILALFGGEYLLRVWTAERRWAYVLSPYGLVDLVAICPFLLGFIDTRFVRLLRWLRILRLLRLLRDRAVVGRLTAIDTLAVIRIVFTLFAIIFIYAGIIFQVEQRYHPETFRSFLDAAYFAVVTMTTVGYGDITPVSDAGRLCTILMILTGIALIPTQLGDLLRRILKASQSLQVPCANCGWSVHDPDASFCKRCGTALPLPNLTGQGAGSAASLVEAAGVDVTLPFAPRSVSGTAGTTGSEAANPVTPGTPTELP